MRSRLLVFLLLAGIVAPVSGALAASTQSSAGIGIRLDAGIADPRGNPLARVYVVGRLAPGTSLRRRIEISNDTSSTADVAVYPAAAGLRRGNFTFAPGHRQNELSSWTSVGQDVLHLSREATALETLTINVPADASAGERYAVVWAEVSAPAPVGGGVMLVNRVGIRVYVTVGPSSTSRSNFAIGAVSATRSANGAPLVVATIRNTGARTLELSGYLTLSKGPGGIRAGPFPVRLETALAPDRSRAATVRLDRRLPLGPWRARLALVSGRIQRVASATITFPSSTGAPTAGAGPAVSRGAMLLALAALILLAAAGAALLRSRRRQ